MISVASSFAMLAVLFGPALLLTFLPENELVASLFDGYRYFVFIFVGGVAIHILEKRFLQQRNKHESDSPDPP